MAKTELLHYSGWTFINTCYDLFLGISSFAEFSYVIWAFIRFIFEENKRLLVIITFEKYFKIFGHDHKVC